MTWVRLDGGFADHPKVIRAGEDAAWLYIAALCYAAEHLTDGFIPEGKVPTLTRKRRAEKLAETLVDVGLWERVADGYQIHDFLDWNPPGGKVRERRAETRQRVADWREKKKRERGPGNADGNALSNTPGNEERNDVTDTHVTPPTSRHDHVLPSEEKALSRAHEARPPAAVAPEVFTGREFMLLFRSVTHRPTGTAGDLCTAARLICEAAELADPPRTDLATFAREVLVAFVAMLRDWKARDKHHGEANVPDFIEHFAKVLGWLEGSRSTSATASPNGRPLTDEQRKFVEQARAEDARKHGGAPHRANGTRS